MSSGSLMPWEDPERMAYTQPPPPGTEDIVFTGLAQSVAQKAVKSVRLVF